MVELGWRDMTNEFSLVGENREDNTQLLVIGTDGNYYGYDPGHDQLVRVHPDESWIIDEGRDETLDELGIRDRESP